MNCGVIATTSKEKKEVTAETLNMAVAEAKTDPPDVAGGVHMEVEEVEAETEELMRDYMKNSVITKALKAAAISKKKNQFGDESRCKICGKILVDRAGLKRHMRVHTGATPHTCSQCPAAFVHAGNLRTHERRVHDKLRPCKCGVCSRSFFNKATLDTHMRIHTGERPYKCAVCDKTFNRDHVLRAHMYIHTGEKPYSCVTCGYACRDNSTLRKHQARHTNTHKRYGCAVCSKRYESKYALRMHIASKHARADIKKYMCEICGAKFTQKDKLELHINAKHTHLVQWQCGICYRRFSTPNNINSHLARHSDQRPHRCVSCDKTFKAKSDLKKHQLIHAPARLACHYCGKSFHRPERLSSHIRVRHEEIPKLTRTHPAEARFECDACGARTRTKAGMVMHTKRHSKAKHYKCETCEKMFRLATSMKRHSLLQHGVRCTTRFKYV